jgi:AcrR family transcriptional regulator
MNMPEPPSLKGIRERRRAARQGLNPRPDYVTVIIEATERVLADTPFYKLTIDQILTEAQVSRGTFYGYFGSKGEVMAELLGRVMAQMYGLLDPLLQSSGHAERHAALITVLRDSAALWNMHRPVFRATHDNWHSVPELRTRWLALVEQFTDAIASWLHDEPGREGPALSNPLARQRCAALLWTTEHLLYLAGTDADADLPTEEAILDTLLVMWEGTLFGPQV